jgi:cytochrome b561
MTYDHWLTAWCAISLGFATFNLTASPATLKTRAAAAVHVSVSAILFLLIFRRMGLGYADMP